MPLFLSPNFLFVKKTIVFLFFACIAADVAGQVELQRAYKPPVAPPATPAPAPVTYDTGTPTPASTVPAVTSRRAAAVAKVQGTQSGAASAKGLSPAMYSTDGTAPVTYSAAPDPATTVTVNGQHVQRSVRKGSGQVGNNLFTPVSELHYVQFAVYCKDTPVDKAPAIEGLYLLWHPGSTCPGGEQGASYIVKGYNSAEEAKAAVATYKAAKVDCWYNPALTRAEVEIIGVR